MINNNEMKNLYENAHDNVYHLPILKQFLGF